MLLRVHQEHFADRAHLTLVTSHNVRTRSLRNVSVRRHVPWDELVTQVMPTFDLFVFPTRFDYSPFAVIEAMAAGLPVIASKVGSIPEMVEDGVTGFLIEPDNAEQLIDRISWALDNRHRLRKMGEQARRSALAAYSADRTYPQLLNLLADVARPGSCDSWLLQYEEACSPVELRSALSGWRYRGIAPSSTVFRRGVEAGL